MGYWSGLAYSIALKTESFSKNENLVKVLNPYPYFYSPSWRLIFEILLSLRESIRSTEKSSKSTRVIEMRNLLQTAHKNLL